jgi:hypothetical protein
MTGSEGSVDVRTVSRLSIVYACGAAALLAATWRLWIGQREFPQTPMFRLAVDVPRFVDGAILTAMASALAAVFFSRTRRTGWVCFGAAWACSAVFDQHRFQVWAWHIVLCGLVLASSTPRDSIRRLRWLTIGIYAWSAFSRADLAFIDGLGSQIAQGLAAAVGVDRISPQAARTLALGFPVGEALTAGLLAFDRTRKFGLVSSIVMHGCLFAALGPLGLGHERGVLFWNLVFIVQNVLLFRETAGNVDPGVLSPVASPIGRWIGNAVVIGALSLPALQPVGLWDVWPSWAVYSARGGRTIVSIHADDAERLPAEVTPHVLEASPLSDWRMIDVDAWSRSTLHCPANPDSRFRFAVAAALVPHGRLQVERHAPPNRWTGVSRTDVWEIVEGKLPREIESMFWLNLLPRQPDP